MFSKKKRELKKTPSISKRNRAGSPIPQSTAELPRKEGLEPLPYPGPSVTETTASPNKLSPSPSFAGTLKRPTSLSRHASAAGIPLSSPNTWVNKGHKAPMSLCPMESNEGSFIEVEDIQQLLTDVARFAERLEKLRDVVLGDENLDSPRLLAHECLGEVLRILKQAINRYPLLNTVETLTAAGTLISKVKGFHYESNNELDKRDFEKSLENIAVVFSSTISELLMGEVDSSTLLSLPPGDNTQSMENLYSGIPGPGPDYTQLHPEYVDLGSPSAEVVDIMLQRYEGGVDAALQYSKNMSKYMKDLIYYLEKRTTLEMEFAKGLQKLGNTCRQMINQEPHMPFLSIYSLALEQDTEYSHGVLQAANTLQNQTFLQPLTMRRLEHEKRRKDIKEHWQRAQRKLQDAESNLRKSKQGYMQRSEEYEKAKYVTVKAEEEQLNTSSSMTTKTLDKKRKLEEEAKNKAEEAMATYRTCIADAKTQKQELEDTKVNVLRQIQDVIKQSDQILKSATISYYQIMHMQTAPLPVHFQTLCESSKLYDLGQQYASYVRQLQRGDEPDTQYDFEPYVPQITWSPWIRARKSSFNASDIPSSSGSESKEAGSSDAGAVQKDQRGTTVERRGGRGHQVHKSWPTATSDNDSVGGSNATDSSSSNSGDFSKKLPRTSSSGTMSSTEELDAKEGNAVSFEQSMNGIAPEMAMPLPTGPFRNIGLSKAAQTHRLRKLRTPSKCRECNSYVYFHGAECEECYLACHKKCLETLAIQCGHKKLQGKLLLFGRDFSQVLRDSTDGIPFIIKKCITEIERRAMKMKGIYRVNGVKTRVEKLCQAFENGKELVELSQASPHDLSNVLKLYLRQLPEPIMLFRFYNDLMGLAKESLQDVDGAGKSLKVVDQGPETDTQLLSVVLKLKDLIQELPAENLATLQYIIQHLKRIAELEQDNKMTPNNLGIVFGPALMRPRPIQATISLSSLVDYPHQARIVEILIIFYDTIFETETTTFVSCLGTVNPKEATYKQLGKDSISLQRGEGRECLQLTAEEQACGSEDVDLHCQTFRENSLGSKLRDHSDDSDSELEDVLCDGVPAHQTATTDVTLQAGKKSQLTKQESETSVDDIPYADDSSEGQRSRTCSLGQEDALFTCIQRPTGEQLRETEDTSMSQCLQNSERQLDAEPGIRESSLSQYNTNQSNNTQLFTEGQLQPYCCGLQLPPLLCNKHTVLNTVKNRQPKLIGVQQN
ncbi:rho GTPase-activating protein 45 isoform X2 [Microcaecilia unicolor]|uniref:Rho GTPase-activating protein 45 isoform X2 n=1 Tax=Microcaecilia unicolor TaxID=1415580 RepID=A0A6P7ZG17_9AMPH|nr:rho GTPase-activating protein 45 isoform X2 [Microcaecilia unicolor]